MSAIIPVTSGMAQTASSTATPKTHQTTLDSTNFMQMLMSELQNQDPMQPMDNKDYLAQLAQMNSVQELQTLNTTLTAFAANSKMSEGAGLIGRKIQASLADGTLVSGVVSSASLIDNDVLLTVGSQQVPFAAVTSVSAQDTPSHV